MFVTIRAMDVAHIASLFKRYTESFPQEEMIQLKIHHTERVVADAIEIMHREHFSEDLQTAGAIAAWLHDVGRFPQFMKYRTFSDRNSENHAVLSCAEIVRLGWLDEASPELRERVLKAVELHNVRDLPSDLSEADAKVAHVVRDADKLDIFTVLEEAIATNYLATHPEVYWGLPFTGPLSKKVIAAIEQGCSVDYGDIQSFADFVLIQVAWCNGGLHFPASCALTLERNCLAIRQEYLCSILPESEHANVMKCCAIAKAALIRKANHGA
jgi:HD superfamily phosphodiesterase